MSGPSMLLLSYCHFLMRFCIFVVLDYYILWHCQELNQQYFKHWVVNKYVVRPFSISVCWKYIYIINSNPHFLTQFLESYRILDGSCSELGCWDKTLFQRIITSLLTNYRASVWDLSLWFEIKEDGKSQVAGVTCIKEWKLLDIVDIFWSIIMGDLCVLKKEILVICSLVNMFSKVVKSYRTSLGSKCRNKILLWRQSSHLWRGAPLGG